MYNPKNSPYSFRSTGGFRLCLTVAFLLSMPLLLSAQDKKVTNPPMGVIKAEAWKAADTGAIRPGEIDAIINDHLKSAGIKSAELTSDTDFLRRAYLDLTGRLPKISDTQAFLKDKSADKRAKLIDRLLESDAYAARWSTYWTNVVNARVSDPVVKFSSGVFQNWMRQQFQANTPWDEVVSEIVTAKGEIRRDKRPDNGAVYFLLSNRGADAVTERAAETSRIFLGIQIQCAQCHDHPFDSWKWEQFHEFAAYFGKARERFVFADKKIVGFRFSSTYFSKYRMTDANDPTKRSVVYAKFLDGTAPPSKSLPDLKLRKSLADKMSSPESPWLAVAFVNRMWTELLGQGFYSKVDDIGPERDALYPKLLTRLSSSFRGSDYDVKQLFRAIINSEAYQRQIRMGKSTDEHLRFAAVYPTKLQADALWNSLEQTLGNIEGFGRFGKGRKFGRYGRLFGTRAAFVKEFSFDPSTPSCEVEGSLSQALFLMNNPKINKRIEVSNFSTLGKILNKFENDQTAVKVVYYHVLTRQPSQNELQRCLKFIRDVNDREEAFEDILWVLVNSTEFRTKR